MSKGFVGLAIAFLVVVTFAPQAYAQNAATGDKPQTNTRRNPYIGTPVDGWTGQPVAQPPAATPAPRHDIFGIWDPGNGGIQAMGAGAMPEDGKPEHTLPYTPEGLEALKLSKPSNGVRSVLPGDTNDPVVACNPQGFPRETLYELRTTQILQTPASVVMLYEFGKVWRVIWTDGRDFPKNPAPRWFGYSIGKWEDDTTFVVTTCCVNDEVWIDRAGRPHSPDMRVEERIHRTDSNTIELTVTINDPKMYTKPWIALNKLPFRLQTSHFDVTEMLCSPAELAEYNKFIGGPASTNDK
jgi:hypothetical protein